MVIVTPLVTSLVVYTGLGLLLPEPSDEADAVVTAVSGPRPGADSEALVPAVERT